MAERTTLSVEVAPEIFERHPDYIAVVIVADNLASGPSDAASGARLEQAEHALGQRGLARAAAAPQLAAWRAAFSAFGAKPSKYPCSAEALAARVLKGQSLPRVNRLVDLYNAVSVRHLVPVGGEDAERVSGRLRLVVCDGGEPFDGADGPAAPGEVAWRDDEGITCRRWNWRQGRRTALTEQTSRAFFVLDRLEPLSLDELGSAVDELREGLTDLSPGCTTATITVDAGGTARG
jgi:DNA/RNA-binding domain of Phe-tRNA-synthetase-like protein